MTEHHYDLAEVTRLLTSMTPEQIREEAARVRAEAAQHGPAEKLEGPTLMPCTEN